MAADLGRVDADLPAMTDGGVAPRSGGLCLADGWCFENPLPQGYDILTMWVNSSTDAWAGGQWGMLMHWDGKVWSSSASSARRDITTLWGSSARDVWALTVDGQVLHWDGAAWSDRQPTEGPAYALWGSGATDVWLALVNGTILRWDGTAYRPMGYGGPVVTNAAIRSSGSSDVWITLNGGRSLGGATPELRHWDGTKLTRFVNSALQPPGSAGPAWALWPISAGDAWAVGGASGDISRWDGTAFHLVPHPAGTFVKVWASGPRDVWFTSTTNTILHWDGTTFSTLTSPLPLEGTIFGTGPSDVWALASNRDLLHWDGTKLSHLSPPSATPSALLGGAGSSSSDIWFHGAVGQLSHWDGKALSSVDSALTVADIKAMWAAGSNDIWAADSSFPSVVLRRQGGTWHQVSHAIGMSVQALSGTGADDIWLVGSTKTVAAIAHWDGHTVSGVPCPAVSYLSTVWASSPTDAWAGGPVGTLLHWDGTAWTPFMGTDVSFTTGPLWASGANDVWFGSSRKLFYHWDGVSMRTVPSPQEYPGSMWGSGPTDAWASFNGLVGHWDGSTWTVMSIMSSGQLVSGGRFWGRAANDVWLLGYEPPNENPIPGMYRWNGTSWTKTSAWLPDCNNLIGTDKDLWVAGSMGKILHRSW